MSARVMITGSPSHFEIPPLAKHVRNAGRWLVQRLSPAASAAERVLAVEERILIGPKKTLVLVRCHNLQFLVATAGDSVGPIIEIAPRKTARRSGKERRA